MDFSGEIAVLEQERRRAATALDFSRARELTARISAIRGSARRDHSASARRGSRSEFESERDAAVADFRVRSTEFTRRLYQLRADHQAALARVRQKQGAELAALTAALAKALELAATRAVPQVGRLRHDAAMHGLGEHYDLAEALGREADALQAALARDGRAAIHAQFAERQRAVVAKHRAFEAAFESKLHGDTQELRTQFARCLAFYKQRVLSQAIRVGVAVSEGEVARLFAPYAMRDAEAVAPPAPPKVAGASARLFNPAFPLRRAERRAVNA